MFKDQDRGETNGGPRDLNELENVLRPVSNNEISAQDKIDIMQEAVAKCPKINISGKGVQIPSLLDLGSEVSLINHSYFRELVLLKIKTPTDEKSDAHILFNLMVANDGQLPIKEYVEIDINFLDQTKLPEIIGWNLIQLVYEVFMEQYGEGKFNFFECLAEVNPFLFSQHCLYYYAEISKGHNYGVQFIYHQTDKDIVSPEKSAHLAKKSPTIFY